MSTTLRVVLVLAATSLIIAAACFYLGGLIAEVASATPIMGVTFKAGGALAGFIISFVILFYAYQQLNPPLMLKVGVTCAARPLARSGNPFTAQATILKRATGSRAETKVDPIWEAGGLTVHLRDIEQDDLVMITIVDSNGGRWESDFFSPLCPSITLI